MNMLRTFLACAASAGLLAGCSALTGRHEDIAVYKLTLTQAAQADVAPATHAWQLVVAEPAAIAPLDGARILVMPTPGEIQFYRSARWRDATPAMLHELMLQALQRSGGPIVAAPASGVRADFVLRSDLQDFQAEYRGGPSPEVVVRLSVQLVQSTDGSVIATRRFDAEETCGSSQMSQVSAAFQRATNRLLDELVEWVVAAGDGAIERHDRAPDLRPAATR